MMELLVSAHAAPGVARLQSKVASCYATISGRSPLAGRPARACPLLDRPTGPGCQQAAENQDRGREYGNGHPHVAGEQCGCSENAAHRTDRDERENRIARQRSTAPVLLCDAVKPSRSRPIGGCKGTEAQKQALLITLRQGFDQFVAVFLAIEECGARQRAQASLQRAIVRGVEIADKFVDRG